MTLRVPIDQFADTVRRVLGTDEAYITSSEVGSTATAFHPDKRVRIVSRSTEASEAVCERLRGTGLSVWTGQWLAEDEMEPAEVPAIPYVVAIAYATGEPQPGVWIDAFDTQPTPAQALRALYDEFRETGELGDVAFEEFVRLANPTVVVASPTELQSYAQSERV